MNKALLLLVGALFVANAHADIFHKEIRLPVQRERKFRSVEELRAANDINDPILKQAIIAMYNQKTASAQLNDKILVAAFSALLTSVATAGFVTFMEWYQEFKIRQARTTREIARIQQAKTCIA